MDINIIYCSKTGNTLKIAKAISDVLKIKHKIKLISVEQANLKDIENCDLLGFGSGIYAWNFHKDLVSFINKIPSQNEKNIFIFSTSGDGTIKQHKKIKEILTSKGFNITTEFACKGLFNWGPFKLFGGTNKGRPNEDDIKKAQDFAKSFF